MMDKITPREALEALNNQATMLFHNNVKVKYSVLKNVLAALEGFILAAESEELTLEKLGWKEEQSCERQVIKRFVKEQAEADKVIEFEWNGTEIIFTAIGDADWSIIHLSSDELLACAIIIRKIKEELKVKEETK